MEALRIFDEKKRDGTLQQESFDDGDGAPPRTRPSPPTTSGSATWKACGRARLPGATTTPEERREDEIHRRKVRKELDGFPAEDQERLVAFLLRLGEPPTSRGRPRRRGGPRSRRDPVHPRSALQSRRHDQLRRQEHLRLRHRRTAGPRPHHRAVARQGPDAGAGDRPPRRRPGGVLRGERERDDAGPPRRLPGAAIHPARRTRAGRSRPARPERGGADRARETEPVGEPVRLRGDLHRLRRGLPCLPAAGGLAARTDSARGLQGASRGAGQPDETLRGLALACCNSSRRSSRAP